MTRLTWLLLSMLALAVGGPALAPKPCTSPPFLSTGETISQPRLSGRVKIGSGSSVSKARVLPTVMPLLLVATTRKR